MVRARSRDDVSTQRRSETARAPTDATDTIDIEEETETVETTAVETERVTETETEAETATKEEKSQRHPCASSRDEKRGASVRIARRPPSRTPFRKTATGRAGESALPIFATLSTTRATKGRRARFATAI